MGIPKDAFFAIYRRFRFFDFSAKIVGDLFFARLFLSAEVAGRGRFTPESLHNTPVSTGFGLADGHWMPQKQCNITYGGRGSEAQPHKQTIFGIWTARKLAEV